ncbi:hypothetical protein BDV95DRAFT_598131 [Massariosphaeria phaeospora]|uniref:F-box domain-containing protein n=1 Tax=Massariosphaeria phaeospora TaxID=100035 RepID=A0A7C8I942_9PLEO|nr:hypothetical protein BDV95DRAFT_598131 [Massariosphaeria phaeospora]
MASIHDCPTELLLNISLHCDQPSLLSLALIAKKFHGPAEEALYTSPVVPNHSSKRSRIVGLVRMLLRRPELVKKVRSLDIFIRDSTEADGGVFTSTDIANAVTTINISGMSKYPEKLLSGWRCEQNWAGLLLYMVPNLEALNLDWSPSYHNVFNMLWSMNGILRLSDFPPNFEGLKNLRMYGCDIQWDWIALPSLQHLELGPRSRPRRGLFPGCFPESNVTSFSYKCSTEVLSPRKGLVSSAIPAIIAPTTSGTDTSLEEFPAILNYFKHLRTIRIQLKNTEMEETPSGSLGYWSHRQPRTYFKQLGSFDTLIKYLEEDRFFESLEHLHITVAEDSDVTFLDGISPIQTLHMFPRLKTLNVPENALFRHDPTDPYRSVQKLKKFNLSDILPSSVEELTISCPDFSVSSVLKELLQHTGALPRLSRVTLHPRNNRGADALSLWFAPRIPWFMFSRCGITISIRWGGHHYEMGRAEEQLDGEVDAMTQWLERM